MLIMAYYFGAVEVYISIDNWLLLVSDLDPHNMSIHIHREIGPRF